MQTTRHLHSIALFSGLIALALSSSVNARSETEDRIQRSFEAAPGGRLVIAADRGSIEIRPTATGNAAIEVVRIAKAASGAREREILQRHRVQFAESAGEIRVTGKTDQDSSWRWWGQGWGQGLQVRFIATIPKAFHVRLQTAGGAINLGDLEGEARLQTSGGSLKAGKIRGPVWGRTSGGSISIEACAAEADVGTSGGSIQLGNMQAEVVARTSGGSIVVDAALGRARLSTSGGQIKVREAHAELEASTSGGSISATFSRQPSGPCSLKTSGGSIEVSLGEELGFDIDAETSGGRVSTELPITTQGEVRRAQLRGTVNGGGQKLLLRTSGGNIRIQKQ